MAAPNSPPASPPRTIQSAHSTTLPALPYSPSFTSSLSLIVLDPSATLADSLRGIRIQAPDTSSSTAQPSHPSTTVLSSVDFASLPVLRDDELPLPLDDPRRKFESAVPGLRLTHPGGRIEGGPLTANVSSARDYRIHLSPTGDLLDSTGARITTPTIDLTGSISYESYLTSLLSTLPPSATANRTSLQSALRQAIANETELQIQELKRQMGVREEAIRKNKEIERKIADMEMARRVERRVEEGMRRMGRG